ncbi:MAG: biotin--[acetyl-CoA-carboxylase] ligase [Clostridiales bacterium]|nr:biotin--[acetyl-CoA-carboxylase] ligase [Clostridiales bacterium]
MPSVKDRFLSMLIKSSDYISGENASKELGVSRAAVNSAVMSLRNDGYGIDSATNRGYLLTNRPDRLDCGSIGANLSPSRTESLTVLAEVDSTNNYCKDLARKGAVEGTVVISDSQTGGKGRRGRSFLSPPGCGIYMSYLLRPKTGIEKISEITCWTAVAVCEAIKEAYGLESGIKWVNDVLMNRMKICGILTEASIEAESGAIDSCIIGIGINVNEKRSDFPAELSEVASSISIENGGKTFMRSDLAAILIRRLDELASGWPDSHADYLEAYRRLCITPGNQIEAFTTISGDSEGKTGEALSIGDDFSLEVRFDGNTDTESLKSGEVSVRGLYGYT